jgi:hypothetical protein
VIKPAPYFAALAFRDFFSAEQPQVGSGESLGEHTLLQPKVEDVSVIFFSF